MFHQPVVCIRLPTPGHSSSAMQTECTPPPVHMVCPGFTLDLVASLTGDSITTAPVGQPGSSTHGCSRTTTSTRALLQRYRGWYTVLQQYSVHVTMMYTYVIHSVCIRIHVHSPTVVQLHVHVCTCTCGVHVNDDSCLTMHLISYL